MTMLAYNVASARILSNPDVMLGADRDEYGCIASAGYAWCNYTQTCTSANELCLPSM